MGHGSVDHDYGYLSASEAREALVNGEFSAVDYVSALLRRIEGLNGQFHAFLSVAGERAICAARRADERRKAGEPLPLLHGIPFAVKDLIDVRGTLTTGHSRVPTVIALRSAKVVSQLESDGAICLGKLALDEFGIGSPLDDLAWSPPANPWDHSRSTGGSSSGCAVALAAGLVPLTLGTDTGGSVRAPAAYCGLVGLKPTHGRVSSRGVFALAPALDVVGPMARTASDCALMFKSLASTRTSATGHGIGVGVVGVETLGQPVDDEVQAAMGSILAVLEGMALLPGEATIPGLAEARETGLTIMRFEAHAAHRNRLDTGAHLYGNTPRRWLQAAAKVTELEYQRALRRGARLRQDVDRLLESFEVLAMPLTFGPAPLLNDPAALSRSGDISMRIPFNITGHPAIAFCTGFNGQGLPLSMQLIGRHGADERLLAIVAALEECMVHVRRRPSDVAGHMCS